MHKTKVILPLGSATGMERSLPSDIANDAERKLTMARTQSLDQANARVARKLKNGDDNRINRKISLQDQIYVIQYNPNRELNRADFTVGEVLGTGNFGMVFKGEAMGLFYPGSRTKVAIKTVHDSGDQSEVDPFLAEIKILSTLDLHCNLVNMLGSHTSKVTETGEILMLLHYCAEGDLNSEI